MGLLEKLSLWLGGGAREVSVVVLGLDNSGKSSLLRALHPPPRTPAAEEPPPPPTVGTRQDHFTAGGVSFSALEVGGGRRHRALWERHYRAADALIYVVDAADPLRLVVSRSELQLVLAAGGARRVPLLVLANKSDRPDALHHLQVAQALSLEQVQGVPWHICAASAASGAGLAEGVAWLARELRTTHASRKGQH
ncbi:ADP-ribosylation factor-like protein 6 [Plutella xylostella]|uniref:ADP-ribosylation factor-like protein 6 n=1 Tax=Plutella xylostella TaxID=51655 RepID=UPI002032F0EE|nr:ADP-ribosylation factor-like protein 6 [Plutella xylostella]XP_048484209.1 ADP-ribosylation factor-like protein 6 [Plutella xylostella]